MFIAYNGLRDAPHRHANTVIGGAFAVDNLIRCIAHMLVNAGKLICRFGDAGNAAVIVQIGTGDVSARPYRQLAVAVLTNDERMHVAAVHAKPLSEQILEPRGIQHGTGTEYTSGREAAQLLRQTGQHIDRIGHNQQNRLTIDCRKLCDDGGQDAFISSEQLQTAFAGLLVCACRNDDKTAFGEVSIVSGHDAARLAERHTMIDVRSFTDSLVAVHIHEYQIGEQSGNRQCVCAGRADKAHADHAAFLNIRHIGYTPSASSISVLLLENTWLCAILILYFYRQYQFRRIGL